MQQFGRWKFFLELSFIQKYKYHVKHAFIIIYIYIYIDTHIIHIKTVSIPDRLSELAFPCF